MYLDYADFAIFNATYGQPNDHVPCTDCRTTGGNWVTERIGDPPMTGYESFWEPCAACICNGVCPGCASPLALSFDLSAIDQDTIDQAFASAEFANAFICLACGWGYDPDPDYDDYDYDYYDDYPALDASDYFGGF